MVDTIQQQPPKKARASLKTFLPVHTAVAGVQAGSLEDEYVPRGTNMEERSRFYGYFVGFGSLIWSSLTQHPALAIARSKAAKPFVTGRQVVAQKL